ncbi:hypothetical protein BDBG_00364 [Blastomyces gilchristii SLH14081]|uniref:Mtf2-like C-terminal domain-containing protein n=2 Tax=Blastomyces gilchristii (strain SLH14081) TaxID=559298 RepID=A0A179UAX1_BLAGS|nr:uncharacterized protein BDBG_00364 [Blastomyces gilchristii SLH14081]OAT03672.1 hypothetical protein BDBG_00364 [Blastomyces gilchristii SLH14081]
MVGNLHRGFVPYQSDGFFLSFLYHTRTLTRPVLRYKSSPFTLSQPTSPPASRRLYQSRLVQFKNRNSECAFPAPDTWTTPKSQDDSPGDISSSHQFSDPLSQSSSEKSSDKDRDWDLLASALDTLKSSSNAKSDASPGYSHFSEVVTHEKPSSIFSRPGGGTLAGMIPTTQKDTARTPDLQKARVTLEDPAPSKESDPIERTPDWARMGDRHRSSYGSEIKLGTAKAGKSAPLTKIASSERARPKTWQENTMSRQSTDEPLGVRSIERAPLEKAIHIPFEKAVRRRKDNPENWQEVDMPDRNTDGEQTLRYQGKVYGFAAGDKDEVVSGMGAFGPGKLAREVGNRAIKQISAELDDCISSGKGDIGIWDVCEEHIFAMLKLFSVEDEVITSTMPRYGTATQRMRRADKRNSQKHHAKTDMESEAASLNNSPSSNPLYIPPGIPRKPFVLHAFPATLLYALRLLHSHFPMSEITIQMHAAIKARGRIARLLASDTEIFNELISYHWHVHNNLPQVNSLLQEMEDNGATISSRTIELLDEIFTQKREERLLGGSSATALVKGTPWAFDPALRAYKDFVGIKGQFEGLFSKVKRLRRFEGHKSKITEKMHRKLPVDIKGSASSEYSRLHRRRRNFMPYIEDDAEEWEIRK